MRERPGGSLVHPRACGGNCAINTTSFPADGPSPRVRGKHGVTGSRGPTTRSIPARAGEATEHEPKKATASVHPRACGGSASSPVMLFPDQGPSPRVRGKLQVALPFLVGVRSIPARAGEADSRRSPNPDPRVHPRACGGSRRQRSGIHLEAGPSPRVRGKLIADGRPILIRGSIPARAGEAAANVQGFISKLVHPRACGGSVQPRPAGKG